MTGNYTHLLTPYTPVTENDCRAVPKSNTTQQRALAAKVAIATLGCIRHGIASSSRDMIPPLDLGSGDARPGVLRALLGSSTPDRHGHTGESPRKGLSREGRLGELRLFSLEKRRLRGILAECINTWREGTKTVEPGAFVFFRVTATHQAF